MLNIISRSIYQLNPTGPKKVVQNLMLGLKKGGISFVLNKKPLCTDTTWIHDDLTALAYLQKQLWAGHLTPDQLSACTLLIGPNIAFDPSALEKAIPGILTHEHSILKYTTLICPSDWVKDFWVHRGYIFPIAVWPVGVDTNQFDPTILRQKLAISSTTIKKDVLIYTKGRNQADIDAVIEHVSSQGFTYTLLTYGTYTEIELIHHALTHSVGLIVVSSESQGIALEELMALDLPLLVWNIKTVNQVSALNPEATNPSDNTTGIQNSTDVAEPAHSVPYFSHACGCIVYRLDEIVPALHHMLHTIEQYKPREYICANLSLKGQAEALLKLHSAELNKDLTKLHTPKFICSNWRNRTWLFPFLLARYILKYIRWKLN